MRRRYLVLALVTSAIIAAGLLTVARTFRHTGAIEAMREVIADLRTATDSCHAALAGTQGELLAYSDWLDSARTRVRDMEGLDPRGVPADSYAVYMDAFRVYNDSAAAWDARVSELQVERDECAATTAAHNAAIDSLRQLLEQQRR
ncbi:MAG TPA: hypothetical protein VK929_00695 [Longimicrobiales bacterium]|nr:hypothetical protein [Longimicrobiales bacterium]